MTPTGLAQEQRESAAVEEALFAFWAVIVNHFPEATTGDLSLLTTINLERATTAAVREWIENNVPEAIAGSEPRGA